MSWVAKMFFFMSIEWDGDIVLPFIWDKKVTKFHLSCFLFCICTQIFAASLLCSRYSFAGYLFLVLPMCIHHPVVNWPPQTNIASVAPLWPVYHSLALIDASKNMISAPGVSSRLSVQIIWSELCQTSTPGTCRDGPLWNMSTVLT